ncbi:MAG: hypothetical protein JST12_14480 [Armatimonadetes bacterium]|nr:hypothetical protein [Armatimonadota bacterium]
MCAETVRPFDQKEPATLKPVTPFCSPRYDEELRLWLYGNENLLNGPLSPVLSAFQIPPFTEHQLDQIEEEAHVLVLSGRILVTGINHPGFQRSAIVPLRWGAPRVLCLSGGFYRHLGPDLNQEPYPAARRWRYEFDPTSDLVVSRREPNKRPTYALHNPTIDKLILDLCLLAQAR